MNLPAPSSEMNIHPARQRSTLLFARIGCAVAAAVGVGLFVATLPTYIAYLSQPCVSTSCIYGQLSESGILTLHSLGLSLSAYAIINTTLVIITGLLCTVVEETMQPAHISLWLRASSQDGDVPENS